MTAHSNFKIRHSIMIKALLHIFELWNAKYEWHKEDYYSKPMEKTNRKK